MLEKYPEIYLVLGKVAGHPVLEKDPEIQLVLEKYPEIHLVLGKVPRDPTGTGKVPRDPPDAGKSTRRSSVSVFNPGFALCKVSL